MAIPLVELILGNELDATAWSDTSFWNAVFDLVSWIKTTAQPTVLENTTFDTPLRSSSASLSGIEQTQEERRRRKNY
jgi:hypothetical protein